MAYRLAIQCRVALPPLVAKVAEPSSCCRQRSHEPAHQEPPLPFPTQLMVASACSQCSRWVAMVYPWVYEVRRSSERVPHFVWRSRVRAERYVLPGLALCYLLTSDDLLIVSGPNCPRISRPCTGAGPATGPCKP